MLRISVVNDPRTTRFKLEGKLAHEWVGEAQKAWAALSELNGKKRLVVELFDVSFVDQAGRELLVTMHQDGATLLGCGPMMSAVIEEIRADQDRVASGSNKD